MSTDNITIYYQNVRGLNSNAGEVRQQILNNNYDVYVLTETWLNSGCFDSEIFENGYVIYRRDRETSSSTSSVRGGGVLIAVSNQLRSNRILAWESDCEDLWVSITVASSKPGVRASKINVCAVYMPPPVTNESLRIFTDKATSNLEACHDDHCCLILGDFNMSSISWLINPNDDTENCVKPSDYENRELLCKFVDFLTFNNLKQFNKVTNLQYKILDLVLFNGGKLQVCECSHPIRNIDKFHPPLEVTLKSKKLSINKNTPSTRRHNFYKADYKSINDYLKTVAWEDEFSSCSSLNEMVERFYNILHCAILKYVPLTKPRNCTYPIWYSRHLIYLLKQKNKYHAKMKKYENPLDTIEFEYLRDDCKKLIKVCYNRYILGLENELMKNPKIFWTHVKNIRKNSNSYPDSMTLNDITSSSPGDIPDMFGKHFASVYVVDNEKNDSAPSLASLVEPLDTIGHFEFSPVEIKRKLKKIDPSKGKGPDNTHPLLLKNCANLLSVPLAYLFNRSLQTGIFPDAWKEARVVPIYKNGKKDEICNYRPISIISAIPKLFESLVHSVIYSHVQKYITTKQHGFMAKRSTDTNLILFTSEVREIVDQNLQMDAVYTDFSKAFDKVNHKILINKLHAFGITDNVLKWCASYLSGRSLRVVVNGKESQPFIAHSGIPQGSILGPLFFSVFINDITRVVNYSDIYLFADDLKLVKSVRNDSDVKYLQDDIDNIQKWCIKNKMILNTTKCLHIKYTRKSCKLQSEYFIDGKKLQEVSTVRDLGIHIDSKLRFSEHIDKIISEANRSLGFILRSTKGFRKPSTVIKLYDCLVRSKLEYGSTVWNPNYKVHIDRIERIQIKLIRSLSYRFKPPKSAQTYTDKLKHFNLHQLSFRRSHQDLLFLHKLLNGDIDCPSLLNKFKFNVPARIPRYKCNLLVPKSCKTNLGRYSPVVRMSRLYNEYNNKIPDIDIHFDKRANFKSKLIKCDVPTSISDANQ